MTFLFGIERRIKNIGEIENLKMVLAKYRVNVSDFGINEAKTLEDLFEEIQSGETTLIEFKGKLLRTVNYAGIDIYFNDGEGTYVLVENKQVFNDGSERYRRVKYKNSH